MGMDREARQRPVNSVAKALREPIRIHWLPPYRGSVTDVQIECLELRGIRASVFLQHVRREREYEEALRQFQSALTPMFLRRQAS
jgi:hypothetical protein